MPTCMRHLITCRCVLPQLKRMSDPPQHQFTVFSVIQDDGNVKPSFAQCNNCGIIHKVIDICRSDVVQREAMGALPTVDDIKVGMHANLVRLLEANDVDVSAWQQAQFIIENKRWGDYVVLRSDQEDGVRQVKFVQIISESMFKVDTHVREEVVT